MPERWNNKKIKKLVRVRYIPLPWAYQKPSGKKGNTVYVKQYKPCYRSGCFRNSIGSLFIKVSSGLKYWLEKFWQKTRILRLKIMCLGVVRGTDPHQNNMDSQHCYKLSWYCYKLSWYCYKLSWLCFKLIFNSIRMTQSSMDIVRIPWIRQTVSKYLIIGAG